MYNSPSTDISNLTSAHQMDSGSISVVSVIVFLRYHEMTILIVVSYDWRTLGETGYLDGIRIHGLLRTLPIPQFE